ncbi:Cation/acetate symporter ActP [Paraburkholderia aspalathi]|uniref:cation/acetate symporter ActP n=1 Tax=Paraburkholderia aspalathi TaxID=1324617 RepID=UPI0006B5715E|nr:cation/acetate symporter ActP [Paraburkholderia aspalathi]MBK3839305.1 sodium/solute symporter [Paraburkholderia aspalathi]CAE6757569.1 Cation/acetate symporter ActP [Paraburkholderia aspalathi]
MTIHRCGALLALSFSMCVVSTESFAAGSGVGNGNGVAIVFFLAFVLATLAITYWAAKRTRSTDDFYAAGGEITAFQNGLAIAGDFMSAGAFLGLTALVFSSGFDGLVYAVGYSTGMPIVVFLVATRLRKLGKYTVADAVSVRLGEKPIRIFSACASLCIVSLYLIAQMVGAGQLIKLLFGIDYIYAEILVGTLMMFYVAFGGMVATTWVQLVKAALLLTGTLVMSFLVLRQFDFSFSELLRRAVEIHPKGNAILSPQFLARDPVSGFSLGLAVMFGTSGLPHILMRFFTVPDARAARGSVFWASVFMNIFFALVFVIGFGSIALVASNPDFLDAAGKPLGGINMVAVHLAKAVGGDALLGFISAVAFATILAVVSGLTLAGSSAVSHDLYACVFRKGTASQVDEVRVSRISTLVLGVVAVVLGIAFRTQNVAYMLGLTFSVACSSTFPVLLLALYWKRLTTFGAVAGGTVGLVSAVLLTIAGPAVWVHVMGNAKPLFSIDPPTIVTMPLAFVTCWLVSVLDRSKQADTDRARSAVPQERQVFAGPVGH